MAELNHFTNLHFINPASAWPALTCLAVDRRGDRRRNIQLRKVSPATAAMLSGLSTSNADHSGIEGHD
jgi:hypothetical protein